MTKTEFLNIISNGLYDFPEKVRKDILSDYEEHFSLGIASGKTEEEIINELGNPNMIVNDFRKKYFSRFNSNTNPQDNHSFSNDHSIKKHSSFSIAAIIILILCSPFILGFSLGVIGILIGCAAVCIGIFIAGIALLIAGIFNFNGFLQNFVGINFSLPLSSEILLGIGTICLAILLCIALFFICRGILHLISSFIKSFN